METFNLIMKILLATINTFAVTFICVLFSKWHRRIEDRLQDIQRYIHHVSSRNDVVYMNQLQFLKKALIEEKRYEEAAKINKLIEYEFNKLKTEN